MRNIVIACSKKWFLKDKKTINLLKNKNIFLIEKKNKLNINYLKKINPSIIFFPHWHFKVSNEIIKKYECICFHTSPLPYGRGGSPIQNLILRNFSKTPVCAIKMTDDIDSGPIYLKKKISLEGNLKEIFIRISNEINIMIRILKNKRVKPKKQSGKVFYFKRLKKNNSLLENTTSIQKIYNKIRMLDSEEYPNAFINLDKIKIVFTNAVLKKNSITCDAKIIKKR
mgnify:CR=1 FL=1